MAKWADYLISGVYFGTRNGSKYVSHVQLHLDTDNGVEAGAKTIEAEVIKKLKAGYTVKTMLWNYSTGNFSQGAAVSYQKVGNYEYLRTHKDGTVTDNLDNMLNMDWIL